MPVAIIDLGPVDPSNPYQWLWLETAWDVRRPEVMKFIIDNNRHKFPETSPEYRPRPDQEAPGQHGDNEAMVDGPGEDRSTWEHKVGVMRPPIGKPKQDSMQQAPSHTPCRVQDSSWLDIVAMSLLHGAIKSFS